jgi:putative transcriptional regulator
MSDIDPRQSGKASLAPGLLIAVPQLQDPNFRQSVVLLLQQNEEGALGVIVNRESPLLLRELCEDHAIPYAGKPDKRVRTGGPVQRDQGLVLYGAEHTDPEGTEVVGGLHVSTSRETLTRLCDAPSRRFNCYSGYAGWGPQQLEGEISEGSWIVAPADPALVLDSPTEDVWRRSMASVGIDPSALVPGGGGAES